jgi:hypothetical protein
VSGPVELSGDDGFSSSREHFESVVDFLDAEEAFGLDHGSLEARLEVSSRELFLRLFQDHLDLRAQREERVEGVVDAAGTQRASIEAGHHRALSTVFGEVSVERLAYRRRGEENLHLVDASLNLPEEKHSHGLRRWSAIEASRGSYDEATAAIERGTGQKVGKRQVESLTQCASADVDAFYAERSAPQCAPGDILVLSVDAKGIVMRPEALRGATKKAAEDASPKLKGRLSKGEKRGRKRMAEIGAVYDVTPAVRSPTDVMAASKDDEQVKGPGAHHKWLTASVLEDAGPVIRDVFEEAQRRDPEHLRTWVALVDGNQHQIDCIEAQVLKRKIDVTIIIDLIHVLEYLWTAAWCFFNEGEPRAEVWVRTRALAILEGKARDVAAGIRRRASSEGLKGSERKGADVCAKYLTNKADYLDYPTALAGGWPIATGIIEGACRHIVKDRFDVTGARWSLNGAEAILKLRVVRSNGDFDDYWRFHLLREHERVHRSRYANNIIPALAA